MQNMMSFLLPCCLLIGTERALTTQLPIPVSKWRPPAKQIMYHLVKVKIAYIITLFLVANLKRKSQLHFLSRCTLVQKVTQRACHQRNPIIQRQPSTVKRQRCSLIALSLLPIRQSKSQFNLRSRCSLSEQKKIMLQPKKAHAFRCFKMASIRNNPLYTKCHIALSVESISIEHESDKVYFLTAKFMLQTKKAYASPC